MPHSCARVSRDCARVSRESARVSRDSARVPIAGSSQKRLWVSVSTLLLASTTGHRCRHCSPQTARSNSFDTLRCYWIRNCRYYSISRTGTGTGTGTGRSRVKKGRRSRGVDAAGVGGAAAGVGGSLRPNRQARPNWDFLLPLSAASRGVLPWPSPFPTAFAVPYGLRRPPPLVRLPLSRRSAAVT